jgi:HEAT repeat protein
MINQHRFIGLGVVVLTVLTLSVSPGMGEEPTVPEQMSIQQLVDGIRTNLAGDYNHSLELARELKKRTPTSTVDTRAVLRLIGDTQGELQQKLIDCVDNINNNRLAQLFIAELENKHPMICAVAAGMCGKLKLKGSVAGLISILKRYGKVDGFADSPAERAAVTAVVALGEIRDERGVPILLEKLGYMNGYEVRALAKFGRQVVPQLFDKIINGENARSRRAAAHAVISITDPDAIPLLRKEVKDKNSQVRRYAIIALLNIEPEQSLNELLGMWEQEGDSLLERQLLYHINSSRLKSKRLCPFLIKVLENNPRRDMRQGAVVALGRIGGEEAVAALKKALRDEEKIVRIYAAQALQMLTGQSYDINMSDI